MDYKKKYLKYKKKYNTIKGGSIINNIKALFESNSISNTNLNTCLNNYLKKQSYKEKNIDVDNQKNLLLIFYVDWCIYCKSFLKEETTNLLSSSHSKNILFIDGQTLDDNLKNKFKVNEYPLILKIKSNSTEDNIQKSYFSGNRNSKNILSFLEEK